MRSVTDTRSLASMRLPDGFSFVQAADTAELWTPEGSVVRFAEGYFVEGVEAAAEDFLYFREMLRDLEVMPPERDDRYLLSRINEFEKRLGFSDEGEAAFYSHEDGIIRNEAPASDLAEECFHEALQRLYDEAGLSPERREYWDTLLPEKMARRIRRW